MTLTQCSRIARLTLLSALGIAVPAQSSALEPAKAYFDWYCAQCHGTDGQGHGVNSSVPELPVGPMDLTSGKEMSRFDGAKIVKTLTHGGPVNTLDSLMPPWGNRFTPEEIENLMRYVRSLCTAPDCPK